MSVSRLTFQPDVLRSADGASACGTFETMTAARKATLIARPVASWIPKMIDSGTPSTTAPRTIPRAPPAPEALLDDPVGDDEDGRPDQEPERRFRGGQDGGLRHQVERHGADQRASADACQHADDPVGDLHDEGKEPAQQKR
jgi:hypothetical protein